MNTDNAPDNNRDDQPTLSPLTPEIIGTINGLETFGLTPAQKREHNRLVAGLRKKRQSGVIVTVVERDGTVRFCRVEQFVIGPEK